MFASGSNRQWKYQREANIDPIVPRAMAQRPGAASQEVRGRVCREIEEDI